MSKNALCAECAYDAELCICRNCEDISACKVSTLQEDGTCKYFITEPFWE